ncbi:MAG: radical SAM protein [Candidatus Zixiibacteriota bacterium]
MKVGEIFCKSALVKSNIPSIDYALNPYLGCEHGCVYCYASFMQRYYHQNEVWGEFVDVKVNFAERLRSQIKRTKPGLVYLSSVTDPYQPLEKKYKLTRECLKILVELDFPVSIQTKSDLVLRDLDILKGMSDCEVGFTITTLDEKIRGKFEPRTSTIDQRFKALKILKENEISTFAFFGPILPYFSDNKKTIHSLLKQLSQLGVERVYLDKINYKGRNWSRISKFIMTDFPEIFNYYLWTKNSKGLYSKKLKNTISECIQDLRLNVEVVF